MTALLAIGTLADCRAFPVNDVTKELLKSVVVDSDYQRACYAELVEPLHLKGRDDLARTIKGILLKYRMKRMLKGMDKRLCGGKLLAVKKAVFKKAKTLPSSLVGDSESVPAVNSIRIDIGSPHTEPERLSKPKEEPIVPNR